MAISVISTEEMNQVSGADYATSTNVAMGFLGLALTVTAPVWGTALLRGVSIAASGAAIYYAW